MKIVKEDGKIKVQSSYSAEFVKSAKMLHGRWSKPFWVFPEENEYELKELLMRVYGENGDEQERVEIIVDISCMNGKSIDLDGMVIATRYSRDTDVKLADNVILIAGGFPESGGSAAHPRVSPKEGTKVRVKDVPMGLYERVKDMPCVELKDAAELHEAKLLAEKERLLARLTEIEAELAEATK